MNNSIGANLEVNCFLLRLYFKSQFTVLLQLEFLLTHGDAVASSIRGREGGRPPAILSEESKERSPHLR